MCSSSTRPPGHPFLRRCAGRMQLTAFYRKPRRQVLRHRRLVSTSRSRVVSCSWNFVEPPSRNGSSSKSHKKQTNAQRPARGACVPEGSRRDVDAEKEGSATIQRARAVSDEKSLSQHCCYLNGSQACNARACEEEAAAFSGRHRLGVCI